MKKIISILAIMTMSSSAFALSPAAIVEALKVAQVKNILSITQDNEAPRPRCMCELVKIEGTDASGNEVTQTLIVEQRGRNNFSVVGQ